MQHTYDSLQIGDSYKVDRMISADDVAEFAHVTGDHNPLHLDPEYAAGTRFGKPIVHGVLILGVISKVLGRDYPGPGSVAVSIQARFLRPVPVGSTATFEVRVAEKIEKYRHIRMKVYAYLDGRMVMGGEAVLIPPGEEASA